MFCLAYPTILISLDKTGLSIFGNCSIKLNEISYGTPILFLFYFAVAIYTIIFFKKTVPDNE